MFIKIGASKEFCYWLGELLDVHFSHVFEWFDSFKHRKVKVKIHSYDTWSMDHTLAHIIHPMLVQLKETKHGSPFVDDDDVPDNLRTTAAPEKIYEWDTDDNHHKRWDYILDEMVFAFSELLNDDWEDVYFKCVPYDIDGHAKHSARLQNGFRLFGKYYRNLWD